MHQSDVVILSIDYSTAQYHEHQHMQCCVFSRSFPHRRTPGGEAVETYEQLVAYLRAKPCVGDGGVQRGFLPFQGRNQVLFSLPEEGQGGAMGRDQEDS